MVPTRAALRSVIVALFILAGFVAGMANALAQSATPPPDKIERLLELLSDPDVKNWLAAQGDKAAAPPPAEAAGGESAMAPAGISSALDMISGHIKEMEDAVPTLPRQFGRAWTILELEFEGVGLVGIVALILGLIGVGLGLVWIVFRLTQGYRDWMKAMPKDAPHGRVRSLGAIVERLHPITRGAFLPVRRQARTRHVEPRARRDAVAVRRRRRAE